MEQHKNITGNEKLFSIFVGGIHKYCGVLGLGYQHPKQGDDYAQEMSSEIQEAAKQG